MVPSQVIDILKVEQRFYDINLLLQMKQNLIRTGQKQVIQND